MVLVSGRMPLSVGVSNRKGVFWPSSAFFRDLDGADQDPSAARPERRFAGAGSAEHERGAGYPKERAAESRPRQAAPVSVSSVTSIRTRVTPGLVEHQVRAGSERVFQRVNQEYQSNIKNVDVVNSSDASHFLFWKQQGWLAKHVPPDVAKFIDPAAQARTLDLMGDVIRTSAENPSPLPPADAVKDNLAMVINATYEQYGSDAQMIGHAEEPNIDRAKVCAITLSVYDRIMSLPPADASALIRSMTQLR